MSSEKNPEVVGCDASIMKDVWEIRAREYDCKMQQEKERQDKSALPTINLDWGARMSARQGGYKRAETRPRKQPDIQTDDVWKSKIPLVPSAPSRPLDSGPGARPGIQSRDFSSPSSKDKKARDKNLSSRQQLLKSINQGQPSSMVWGKSWKYNKGLPFQAEGSTLGWGQNWLFAVQQPFTETGKPWPNGPSQSNPNSLKIRRRPAYKMVDSQKLDSNLLAEDWKMSWIKYDKQQMKQASQSEDNDQRFALNISLDESQRRNEKLSSSEWEESWKATKPVEDDRACLVDSLTDDSVFTQQNKNRGIISKWEESWKFSNQQSCKKTPTPDPEWARSWSAATVAPNSHNDGDPTLKSSTNYINGDLFYHNYTPRYKALVLQLGSELDSQWKTSSWQMTKNNSKPSEEIEKVLKRSSSTMEAVTGADEVEKYHQKPQTDTLDYEMLKHNILYQPERELSQSKLFFLKYLEKRRPSSEWKDSWKMIKHQMRLERRRIRPNTVGLVHVTPAPSEWKDSWRSSTRCLGQVPDMWHQEWPATAQNRVNRARDQEHFEPVERPKNGPSGEPGWGQSWMFSRRHLRSEPQQSAVEISQAMSRRTSQNPAIPNMNSPNQWVRGGNRRSTSDWQPAWMLSETHFHHDNPAFSQWREAWRFSIYRAENWTDQETTEHWVNKQMEIQPPKQRLPLLSAKAKMSRSFEQQRFMERFPEKDWQPSWSGRSLLNHQQNHSGPSNINVSSSRDNEKASQWGLSFRLANPMPPTETSWLTSCSNADRYPTIWAKVKKTINVLLNFTKNPATVRLWLNSCCFLQSSKSQPYKPTDPRVIIPRKNKTRKHLFSATLNAKQLDRKWVGCHLLGKTQPLPKKNSSSVKKVLCEDSNEDGFLEEWAESWRLLVSSRSLKKQNSFKSPSGWNDSWKFRIPQYQSMKNNRGH